MQNDYYDLVVNNMSRALCQAARFKQKVKTTGRAFVQWKMFAHFTRLRKQHQKMLDKEIKRKYLNKAWESWMVTHRAQRDKRKGAQTKADAEQQIEATAMKYQKEISLLQNRLSEALAEVHAAQQHKRDMQNQLKRSFMRGLCAMNLEAMDVLNPEEAKQMGLENLKDDTGAGVSEQAIINHFSKDQNQTGPAQSFQKLASPNGLPDFQSLLPNTATHNQHITNSLKNDLGLAGNLDNNFNSMNMGIYHNSRKEYPSEIPQELIANREDKTYLKTDHLSYDPMKYKNQPELEEKQEINSHQEPHTNFGQLPSSGDDNIDDLYENMLKEFKNRGPSDEPPSKVTLVADPLVASYYSARV